MTGQMLSMGADWAQRKTMKSTTEYIQVVAVNLTTNPQRLGERDSHFHYLLPPTRLRLLLRLGRRY